jgi:hypothetical protein
MFKSIRNERFNLFQNSCGTTDNHLEIIGGLIWFGACDH